MGLNRCLSGHKRYVILRGGEMSEWSNVPLSKSGRVNSPRGFESHLLRQRFFTNLSSPLLCTTILPLSPASRGKPQKSGGRFYLACSFPAHAGDPVWRACYRGWGHPAVV